MHISILCSSKDHPVYPFLTAWRDKNSAAHTIDLVNEVAELKGGDVLFLISCSDIVDESMRRLYKKTLVIHASDLPRGRGWSPHIQSILAGEQEIVVSLLEAEEPVDSGKIWKKKKILLEGHELYDEINRYLFQAELALMDYAVDHFDSIEPFEQVGEPSYFEKRQPCDSEFSVSDRFSDVFNLLRVSDPNRFPAFFYHKGHKYFVNIEKAGDGDE